MSSHDIVSCIVCNCDIINTNLCRACGLVSDINTEIMEKSKITMELDDVIIKYREEILKRSTITIELDSAINTRKKEIEVLDRNISSKKRELRKITNNLDTQHTNRYTPY